MTEPFDFSDISPYRDDEVPAVLARVVEHPSFLEVMQFVNPHYTIDELKAKLLDITSIDEFQAKVAYPSMKKVIDNTITALTFEGLEHVSNESPCLFISNHRDIILDSAILNVIFFENQLTTTQTAIGDNLISTELVRDLMKLNKNFTVTRNVAPKEKYEHSYKLSAYIHESITNGGESIWISQKEGRAKDGNDKTQPGLIKMLSLNDRNNFQKCFEALNIHPVAISYEYDPCDHFKVKELLALENGETYVKQEGEDLRNIVTGITGSKGRVHFCIQDGINGTVAEIAEERNINERTRLLALAIDKKIHDGCKLWPNNYLAADMYHNKDEFATHYSDEDREAFENHLAYVTDKVENEKCRAVLLKKYAYPLWNQIQRELV